MSSEAQDLEAIQKACMISFGVALKPTDIIARDIPAGIAARATVFGVGAKGLYVYIFSQGGMVLADVKKIIRQMQCEPDMFFPPRADGTYFHRVGVAKFKTLFPGKHITSSDDTRYYETLAPYNPALVRISQVNGELRGFVTESKEWRRFKAFTFTK